MSALYARATTFACVWTWALCLTVPALAQEKAGGGGVTMDKQHIVVHPMTKISKGDVKAINNILMKYDKSFYKLATYKDGKLKKTHGTLSDVNLDQVIASELAAAQAKGQSNKTMQFTNPQHQPRTTTSTQPVPSASTNPQRAPGNVVNPQHAARELIERLKPILEKYSRK
jgi:hypothetical protein